MSSTNQRQVQNDLHFLQQRPVQMSMLAAQYRRTVREIHNERPYLMPREFTRRLNRAQEEFDRARLALAAECLNARERLEATAELSKGANGRRDDPAAVVLEQRAWQRILPVLQHQPSHVEAIARAEQLLEEAGRRGDVATIRAFATEMPLWLESHEHPQDRARREAVGQSFAQSSGDLQRLMSAVAQAGQAHLTPEERAAFTIEQELQRYDSAITGNLARLELIASDPFGITAQVGMASWSGGYIRPDSNVEEPAQSSGSTSAEAAGPGRVAPAAGSLHAFRSPEMDNN